MADNNRDDRNPANREEAVIPVPLPLSSSGSGYVPAVVPVKTEVNDADTSDADAVRVEPVLAGDDRADERIDHEIHDHLTQSSYINSTEVAVSVKNGEVTLTGSVPDADQSRYVEEIARKVADVKNVQNQLTIKQAQSPLTQNSTGKQ